MTDFKSFQQKRETLPHRNIQCDSMDQLREEIDRLDRMMVELMSIRQGYMEQAAHIKDHRLKVRDEQRVQDVVDKVVAHAEQVGAHPELVENIYRTMIEWCISYELNVFDQIKNK